MLNKINEKPTKTKLHDRESDRNVNKEIHKGHQIAANATLELSKVEVALNRINDAVETLRDVEVASALYDASKFSNFDDTFTGMSKTFVKQSVAAKSSDELSKNIERGIMDMTSRNEASLNSIDNHIVLLQSFLAGQTAEEARARVKYSKDLRNHSLEKHRDVVLAQQALLKRFDLLSISEARFKYGDDKGEAIEGYFKDKTDEARDRERLGSADDLKIKAVYSIFNSELKRGLAEADDTGSTIGGSTAAPLNASDSINDIVEAIEKNTENDNAIEADHKKEFKAVRRKDARTRYAELSEKQEEDKESWAKRRSLGIGKHLGAYKHGRDQSGWQNAKILAGLGKGGVSQYAGAAVTAGSMGIKAILKTIGFTGIWLSKFALLVAKGGWAVLMNPIGFAAVVGLGLIAWALEYKQGRQKEITAGMTSINNKGSIKALKEGDVMLAAFYRKKNSMMIAALEEEIKNDSWYKFWVDSDENKAAIAALKKGNQGSFDLEKDSKFIKLRRTLANRKIDLKAYMTAQQSLVNEMNAKAGDKTFDFNKNISTQNLAAEEISRLSAEISKLQNQMSKRSNEVMEAAKVNQVNSNNQSNSITNVYNNPSLGGAGVPALVGGN